MKYDSMRKIERNEMVIEYYHAHPELSLNEIGKRFEITGSRVWRIVYPKGKVNATKRD